MEVMRLYRLLQRFVGQVNALVADLYNEKKSAEEVENLVIPLLEELSANLKKKE